MPNIDPLYLQKHGIATSRLAIDPTHPEVSCAIWQHPHRVRSKKLSTYIGGELHLTPLGWARCRKEVKRDYSTKRPFKHFEEIMQSLLCRVAEHEAKQPSYHDDLGYRLPMLVLTTTISDSVSYKPVTPPLKGARKLVHICHQSGGYCCSQQEWDVLVLKMTPLAQRLATKLLARYDSSSITTGANFNLLEDYNKLLGRYTLRCTTDYLDFCESVFPIDIEHVRKLTTSRLPKDLDSLIDWDAVWAKAPAVGKMVHFRRFGSRAHWRLFLLTENCD